VISPKPTSARVGWSLPRSQPSSSNLAHHPRFELARPVASDDQVRPLAIL
jgi:hypothetical protein